MRRAKKGWAEVVFSPSYQPASRRSRIRDTQRHRNAETRTQEARHGLGRIGPGSNAVVSLAAAKHQGEQNGPLCRNMEKKQGVATWVVKRRNRAGLVFVHVAFLAFLTGLETDWVCLLSGGMQVGKQANGG